MNTALNAPLNAAQTILVNGGVEISRLKAAGFKNKTHRVDVITDEEGNGIAGFIIVGKNSAEAQTEKNRSRVENIMRAGKRAAAVDTKTEEGATIISDTVAGNDHAKALAVVTGWYGFMEEGQPATFNRDVVAELLKDMPFWEEKILAAFDVDANFMKV